MEVVVMTNMLLYNFILWLEYSKHYALALNREARIFIAQEQDELYATFNATFSVEAA